MRNYRVVPQSTFGIGVGVGVGVGF